MRTIGIGLLYGAILLGSWELQKVDMLLGYTLGLFGILGATVWLVDHLTKKYL